MKKVILFVLLWIMAGSLSSCTPQLSDQQIKEDILNIVEFRSASLISDQTTITKEKMGTFIMCRSVQPSTNRKVPTRAQS